MDWDEKTRQAPKNAEHAEALQDAVNKTREDFVKSLPKGIQANFKFIEKFVSQIEKRNLPFILFVNPGGYEFNDESPSANNYWRWQKFHGNTAPYSQECKENCEKAILNLTDKYINFITPFYGALKLVVYDENDKPLKMYKNGQVFQIKPPIENE